MFDANLFHLPRGRQAIALVSCLSKESPLFTAGVREGAMVLCRKPLDQADPDRCHNEHLQRVEVKVNDDWHAIVEGTPHRVESLILETGLPLAPEYVKEGDHPFDRFTVAYL